TRKNKNEEDTVKPSRRRRGRRQGHDHAVEETAVPARQEQGDGNGGKKQHQVRRAEQEQRGRQAFEDDITHLTRPAVAGQLDGPAQGQGECVYQVFQATLKERPIESLELLATFDLLLIAAPALFWREELEAGISLDTHPGLLLALRLPHLVHFPTPVG